MQLEMNVKCQRRLLHVLTGRQHLSIVNATTVCYGIDKDVLSKQSFYFVRVG